MLPNNLRSTKLIQYFRPITLTCFFFVKCAEVKSANKYIYVHICQESVILKICSMMYKLHFY